MPNLLSVVLITESSRERQVVFRYPLNPLQQKRCHNRTASTPSSCPLGTQLPTGGTTTRSDHYTRHPTELVTDRPVGYIFSNDQVRPRERDHSSSIPNTGYAFTDEMRGLQYYSPGLDYHSLVEDASTISEPAPVYPGEAALRMSTENWSTHSGLPLSNKVILTFIARTAALCNQRFQFLVDDLLFLGQPLLFHQKVDTDDEVQVTGNSCTVDSSSLLPNHALCTRFRHRTPGAPSKTDTGKPRRRPSATGHSNRKSPNQSAASLPYLFDYDSSDSEGENNVTMPSNQYQATMFHMMFVLDMSAPNHDKEVNLIYDHVIAKLCTVLKFAQKVRHYVTNELHVLMGVLESATANGAAYREWQEMAYAQSSLARTIVQVYDAVCYGWTIPLAIDDRFHITLQVPKLKENVWQEMPDEELKHRLASYPYIQPHQILLPLEEPKQMLQSLPPDANLTIALLISELPNRRALGDLHSVIDCSLAQMYRLAAHMIYWNKCKVINKPKLGCEYIVSPNADLSQLGSYNAEFSRRFPKIDLVDFLASFSTPKSYFKHIQNRDNADRIMYFGALEFLLSHDLVTEIHTYVYAKTPSHIKPVFPWDQPPSVAETPTKQDSTSEVARPSDQETPDSSPSPVNLEEWLRDIDDKYSGRKLRFHDLYKYLDGKHSTYEIHYLLQMPFRELKSTLKQYRTHILSFKHH
ncbi:Nitrogen permease regulator 3 [Dispira simplex]|nr:Nitrogen permease regulator 3 [Dispira simplex]